MNSGLMIGRQYAAHSFLETNSAVEKTDSDYNASTPNPRKAKDISLSARALPAEFEGTVPKTLKSIRTSSSARTLPCHREGRPCRRGGRSLWHVLQARVRGPSDRPPGGVLFQTSRRIASFGAAACRSTLVRHAHRARFKEVPMPFVKQAPSYPRRVRPCRMSSTTPESAAIC